MTLTKRLSRKVIGGSESSRFQYTLTLAQPIFTAALCFAVNIFFSDSEPKTHWRDDERMKRHFVPQMSRNHDCWGKHGLLWGLSWGRSFLNLFQGHHHFIFPVEKLTQFSNIWVSLKKHNIQLSLTCDYHNFDWKSELKYTRQNRFLTHKKVQLAAI